MTEKELKNPFDSDSDEEDPYREEAEQLRATGELVLSGKEVLSLSNKKGYEFKNITPTVNIPYKSSSGL